MGDQRNITAAQYGAIDKLAAQPPRPRAKIDGRFVAVEGSDRADYIKAYVATSNRFTRSADAVQGRVA